MAKQKEQDKLTEKQKGLEEALEEIQQRFGEGAIMQLSGIRKVDVDSVSTGSIALDSALGVGGVPRGRIIEIYGSESSGKTTLALHILAEAQRKGGNCAFIDAEHAMDPDYAKKIGVDTNTLLISQPDSGEQALQIVETLVRSKAVDVIVVDSVAALTPKAEIEGEIGDVHMGRQARLLSQAMRKLAAITSQTNTIIIFINQTRMKIGVVFGCLEYHSKINLHDGTTEWIGRIVNQRKKVKVLSYDWQKGRIVAKEVIGWYRNGSTDKFLQITAYKPHGNGAAHIACTVNHPILTPTGWRKAEDISVGDKILVSAPFRLSDFQLEIIRGSLLGDGNLSENGKKNNGFGIRFRLGHGLKQKKYLEWKASLFKNINSCIYQYKNSIKFDSTPLPELFPLKKEMYKGKYKFLSADFLAALTPLSLGIWYMDDGSLDIRDKAQTKGRIAFCVQKIHPASRVQIQELLVNRYDVQTKIRFQAGRAILVFDQGNTKKFLNLIKKFIHPSMDYKLLPEYRGRFSVEPSFSEVIWKPIATPVISVRIKAKTRSMMRFDIQVRGTHNFLTNGAIVHNSPITTPGGMALKFYSSVRIQLSRIAQIKKGDGIIGSRIRAKIVKNKVAAPFKSIEFDIYWNEGISKAADIVNTGLKYGVVKKSGSWFQYKDTKLGQGIDGAKNFLKENKPVAKEIKKDIHEAMKDQLEKEKKI